MIAQLTGKLLWKRPPRFLLDVGGVGYELEAPLSCFDKLPEVGAEGVMVQTHLLVREDSHSLFAFADAEQRQLFRSLLKVSGVGARLALAILSTMPARDFGRCLLDRDVQALLQVPGVGKKMAGRIVLEMRDRWLPETTEALGDGAAAAPAEHPVRDAVQALVSLGYKPQEASRFVHGLGDIAGMGSEEIIRAALRQAAR